MLRALRTSFVCFLKFVATVLVFATPLGIIVTIGGFAYWQYRDVKPTDVAVPAFVIRFVVDAVLYGSFMLPVGVFLHFLVARATGSYPRWIWQIVFLSCILACTMFPLGTIVGAVTLWRVIGSETFKKMRSGRTEPEIITT
jgi:hypothetical protein